MKTKSLRRVGDNSPLLIKIGRDLASKSGSGRRMQRRGCGRSLFRT